jgi:hypothetical protein
MILSYINSDLFDCLVLLAVLEQKMPPPLIIINIVVFHVRMINSQQ